MFFVLIILFIFTIGIARHALQRHEQGVALGAKATVPGAQTAAEVAREFLDANDAADVRVMEHTAMVSDYFDTKRRVLFLTKPIMEGTDASSWAIALHEAAHATQRGESAKALEWRLGNIRLARYAPALIGILALTFIVLKRLTPRTALLICVASCALIMLVNAMSMAVEYNASQRAMAWLEEKLKRHPAILELFGQILPRVAWRDTGVLIKSPLYLLFGMLPVGGRLRPK